MSELALPDHQGAIQLLLALEAEGAVDEVSLTLSDPDMPYERWEALGVFLGNLDRRSRWYIGDWLNTGEELYGHDASQGIDDTTKTRYSEAERVTGLDHQTLLNIRSVCGKVPKERRRKELGFWIHQEVAPLEPADQENWLAQAIDEGWTRSQLRDAIRGIDPGNDPPDPPPPGEPGLTRAELLDEAARRVFHQSQPTPDGGATVPPEPWAALKAALGEGE